MSNSILRITTRFFYTGSFVGFSAAAAAAAWSIPMECVKDQASLFLSERSITGMGLILSAPAFARHTLL